MTSRTRDHTAAPTTATPQVRSDVETPRSRRDAGPLPWATTLQRRTLRRVRHRRGPCRPVRPRTCQVLREESRRRPPAAADRPVPRHIAPVRDVLPPYAPP